MYPVLVPKQDIILIETYIPEIVKFNKGWNNDVNIGIFEIANREEAYEYFSKAILKGIITIHKPTEEHYNRFIDLSADLFIKGKIRVIFEATLYMN